KKKPLIIFGNVEYLRDDIDTQELKGKINELGMWEIGCLYNFTFLMKNQVSCQLIEFIKSHNKRTEVGVKDVDCNILESNWNKWNDLAFHRGSHWANF
ncbi:hypothetical protein RhiirC2_795618, partial [Rhizophagus irregularis]